MAQNTIICLLYTSDAADEGLGVKYIKEFDGSEYYYRTSGNY